ncbi:MAG: hypothetical protein AAF420_09085 [Pseudomonadota bacterium]
MLLTRTVQMLTIVFFVFAAGTVQSHEHKVKKPKLRGVVYYTCIFQTNELAPLSRLGVVDRSDDRLPKPRDGSTCSQYLAELLQQGACPPPASSCSALNDISTLYPSAENEQSCINMVLFGPAFC